MEPKVGIEPTTACLQNRCSTTELLRLKQFADWWSCVYHLGNSFPIFRSFLIELYHFFVCQAFSSYYGFDILDFESSGFFAIHKMEPKVGFEPTTSSLQVRRSPI